MEIKFSNYSYNEKLLNLEITSGNIIGITGTTKEELIEIIALNKSNEGIIINNEKLTKENINTYRRKIIIINENINSYPTTVINLMKDYIKRNNLIIKDPIKKINDSLKIVGLESIILEKEIYILSSSEKKLLQYALALLSNPEIIIIKEPFKWLDKQNEKKIIMLMQRLRDQFKKTIIISSEDSNVLYKYTDKMIFIKNGKVILDGPTKDNYLRVDFLRKNKFSIPEIVEFTYIAKKNKSVKIDYHTDVRDIIKDIYKHI